MAVEDLKSTESAITPARPARVLDTCVICLDDITERAIAVPCNHCTFDYLCLISWLQDNPTCPLCKVQLTAVQYDFRAPDDFKTFRVAQASRQQSSTSLRQTQFPNPLPPRRRPRRPPPPAQPTIPPTALQAVSRRRHIYKDQLYSLHVGTNRQSQYRDITPTTFSRSNDLQSRARKWIRRELQVFDFLSPDGPPSQARRRAANAEFLLEYIVAVLRTVEIKGSSGKDEEMIGDFLGLENARLFLHELNAWLRSPYNQLEDWDRKVQYRERLKS